ncbi:DUF6429 family protein [Dyella sp. Tek66A03]|uniref:DUF6429 family protein n=1 Tax=Dyella sp. Tek66A03 TaxID=3458298 RepID=UPI00403E5544
MDLDADKIDEAALALLYLTLHDIQMVWKGMDWEVTGRLFAKGLILNPVNKSKQMTLTDEGLQAAEAACRRLFSAPS